MASGGIDAPGYRAMLYEDSHSRILFTRLYLRLFLRQFLFLTKFLKMFYPNVPGISNIKNAQADKDQQFNYKASSTRGPRAMPSMLSRADFR